MKRSPQPAINGPPAIESANQAAQNEKLHRVFPSDIEKVCVKCNFARGFGHWLDPLPTAVAFDEPMFVRAREAVRSNTRPLPPMQVLTASLDPFDPEHTFDRGTLDQFRSESACARFA